MHSGIRTGGILGVKPPPLTIGKEIKTSLFQTIRFSPYRLTETAETAIMFFCDIQLAYTIFKKYYCDAIIPSQTFLGRCV